MKKMKLYEQDDQMASLIRDNYNVLQALSAFGIGMGFGDKTVREVCRVHSVDTFTFLAVVNLTINGYHSQSDVHHLSVPTLLRYLRASHRYYIDFLLPRLRGELAGAIDKGQQLAGMILSLFDEYARFISHHMRFEEKTLFPYVEGLQNGTAREGCRAETFSRHHDRGGDKLRELKSVIIKYLPSDPTRSHLLTAALHGLYNLEELLSLHDNAEEGLLMPALRELEQTLHHHEADPPIALLALPQAEGAAVLSGREKDVVRGVVQGLTNKEIADRLFIAPNTVITHRRNIARKLQIHSVAALTIYAIVNKIVKL